MPFTLTLNPDELDGQPWVDQLLVRLPDQRNFPGNGSQYWHGRERSFTAEDDGTYAISLPSLDEIPGDPGYEVRYSTLEDRVPVPAQPAGTTVALPSFITAPVAPFVFPTAEQHLASVELQVSQLTALVGDLTARMYNLEAFSVVDNGDGTYTITGSALTPPYVRTVNATVNNDGTLTYSGPGVRVDDAGLIYLSGPNVAVDADGLIYAN